MRSWLIIKRLIRWIGHIFLFEINHRIYWWKWSSRLPWKLQRHHDCWCWWEASGLFSLLQMQNFFDYSVTPMNKTIGDSKYRWMPLAMRKSQQQKRSFYPDINKFETKKIALIAKILNLAIFFAIAKKEIHFPFGNWYFKRKVTNGDFDVFFLN